MKSLNPARHRLRFVLTRASISLKAIDARVGKAKIACKISYEIDETPAEAYALAVLKAAREMRVAESRFPPTCPFALGCQKILHLWRTRSGQGIKTARLKVVGDLHLEQVVVNPGEVQALRQHLGDQRLREVHNGENAVVLQPTSHDFTGRADKALAPHPPVIAREGGCASLIHPTTFVNSVWLKQ